MNKFYILAGLFCLGVMAGCGGSANSAPTAGGAAALQSIQITPGSSSIAAGLGQQFNATGTYSDHTSKDLTSSATWSSSNTSAVTIAGSGIATSKGPGSATITAIFSGVSGSATLTVTAPTLVSLAISPGSGSVPLGATLQFAATGTFTDGSTQDMTASAQWASTNSAVAGINMNGTPALAKGIALGTSTITATVGSISRGATLTVASAALNSIAVTPMTASIAQGTTIQFAATGTFTDGSMQNLTTSVQWASANASAATINVNGARGLAMGIAPGVATNTATSGAVSSSATLTITNATLNSIAVSPASASLPLGTLQQFTATGTFSDATTQDITGTVTWSSSNTNVVSITVSGLATARNLGTVTIKAVSGSVNGTASASVNAADLASITILPGNVTIAASTSQQLSAIGTFNDGGTRDLTTQATWTSSDAGIAKLGGASGLIKGMSPGSVIISATLGSVSASITLNVTNATIVSISVTPVNRTIAPGTKLSFVATGSFSDSSTQIITRDVTWASDNVAVATARPVGIVTAVAPGSTNISATFNSVTAAVPLNVSSATLTSITVNPNATVLAPASTVGYSAIGTFSDGSTQSVTNVVTWSSSAPTVASITNGGLATGQSPGTATITAQVGAVNGTAALVVESSPLISVQVTPASATAAQQTAAQFRAIGTFADGSTQDLTGSASWTSSPVSVATVSDAVGSKGLASGVAPGTATITALFAGQVGTASFSVTSATLTLITVTPSSPSIPLGNSQQFTATGNFSDGTTQNLTSQVTWTSSSVNVATVGGSGLANTAGAGTTTITASMNGVSGATTLTVY